MLKLLNLMIRPRTICSSRRQSVTKTYLFAANFISTLKQQSIMSPCADMRGPRPPPVLRHSCLSREVSDWIHLVGHQFEAHHLLKCRPWPTVSVLFLFFD